MNFWVRSVAFLLIFFIVLQSTAMLVAPSFASASDGKVTKFRPESAETDPIVEQSSGGGSSWWKWTLGIALAAGLAAAAGGGGGGSSSSGSSTNGGGNNSGVSVGW